MPELTILGTSSMVPTKDRNVQAFYLEYEGEGMLFDCGEGTQRQMNIAGIPRGKVHRIFISHWHGDHVGGLIGLIQTIGNSNYQGQLHVYGPAGTKERMFHMLNATLFENKVDIQVHEIKLEEPEQQFLDTEKYRVTAVRVDHSVPCIGYAWYEKDRIRVDMNAAKKLGVKEGPMIGKLQRGQTITVEGKQVKPDDILYKVTGKKIAIIPDTQFSEELFILAKHADIVICESTYGEEHQEKAAEFKHMTARQAAYIASQSDAKKLILTHFSQRYASVHHLLEEARDVFPNTEAAFDLMKISI